MTDRLERGAVAVWGASEGELQRVSACTGRAEEWGRGGGVLEKEGVVPPVSSLSPTEDLYSPTPGKKQKPPHAILSFRHLLSRWTSAVPPGHLLSHCTLGTGVLDLSFLPSFLSLSIHPHFLFSCCLLKTIQTSLSKHASFRMQGTTLLSCL